MKICIIATLDGLVDKLDARARVMVYEGANNPIFNGCVYELLNDNNEFMSANGSRKVEGLTITCGYVNILLEEV